MNLRSFLPLLLVVILATPLHAQLAEAQRARLEAEARALGERSALEREDAVTRAVALGIPTRELLPGGRLIELQRFLDGRPEYYLTDNSVAAASNSSDKVYPGGALGLSLNGAGVTLSLWDGGAVRTTHQEFGNRATQKDNANTLSDHATHVGGTMVAAGVKTAARGMAWAGNLQAHDWNNDLGEMTARAAEGMQVSNHSYSSISGWIYNYRNDGRWAWFGTPSDNSPEDRSFGIYDTRSREWDNLVYNSEYFLPVKSAGNDRGEGPSSQPVSHWEYSSGQWRLVSTVRDRDGGSEGYDCISTYGNAKNILTVGAVEDMPSGYSTSSDVRMTSFSCWGPSDDGRIKPDIVANGTALYSSLKSSSAAYASYTGTSMSSPSVAGSIGLLLQHQKNLHGATRLRASTIKAIVLHTADEAGDAPGPDYRFGWGMMNTTSAAKLMSLDAAGSTSNIIREVELQNGATYEFPVYSPGRGPVKVTICWSDAPGTAQPGTVDPSNRVLVNDLDLRVIDPYATTHQPWVLDPSNPSAPASFGDNIRDNIEQVYILSPVEGQYTVRIRHKGSLQGGRQIVSVVASVSNAPSLLSPPNALTTLSITPALQWSVANGATSYELVVSESPAFTNPVIARSDVSAAWFDAAGLKRLTRYYWRVRVRDGQGVSDWSDAWSFTTGGATALAGHALYFDGADDHLLIPAQPGFAAVESGDAVTVEAWVRLLGWSGGSFPIAGRRDATGSGWQFRLHATNGLEFLAGNTSAKTNFSPQTGRWYHVAVSYRKTEGKLRFYVDGARKAELNFTSDIPATGTAHLAVGGFPGDDAGNGVMDELRIWSVARSDVEISAGMYSSATGGEPGLATMLRFDEGRALQAVAQPGNVAADLVGGPAWLVSDVPLVAPMPPQLVFPGQNGVNIPVRPELRWQPSTGALSYRVQISDRADFSNLILDARNVTGNTVEGPALQAESQYWWRANATNPAGTSDWATPHRFTTAIAPPDAPKLVTPKNAAINQPVLVTLLWDAPPRALRYEVQVSTDSLFEGALLLNVSGVQSPTAEVRDLGNFTTYYWRVRASNFGGVGPWSEVWSFATLPAEPDAPVLISPDDAASGVAVSPQFTWSAVESATSYHIQLSDDPAFGGTILDAQGIPLTRYAASGLQAATWHYWRVRASNAAGTGPWSAVSRFRTVRPAPGGVMLRSPADGETGVTERPEFQWEADSTADTFTLQVARDAAFTQLVVEQKNITANRRISPQALPNNATLYWRVAAANESGSGPLSEAWSFTVIDSLVAPLLIAPANGATVAAEDVGFLWHTVTDADGYELDLTGPGVVSGLTQADTSAVKTLEAGSAYSWRVRAWRGPKAGPWSETWTLNTAERIDTTTDVRVAAVIPFTPEIRVIYPNPVAAGAAGEVHVGYALPVPGAITLELRDLLARRVVVLDQCHRPAGAHATSFRTSGLAAGSYLLVLRTSAATHARVVVVR